MMRTVSNVDRCNGGNLITLPELSAALSNPVATLGEGDKARKRRARGAFVKSTRATKKASMAIPSDLLTAARKTFDAAMSGDHPVDPMLGRSLSCLTSAVNSVIKRSGSLIEKSVCAALEQAGYMVFPQVAMHLSNAAQDLVRANARETLRGVSVKLEAPVDDAPLVIFDMLVFDPRKRRATLIECKRGNGQTEARKVEPISATLLAGSLQVASYLKAMGITVKSVDARVIDYYGHSGFSDDIRITGDQLDAYFRVPVTPLVDAVLNGVRDRLFAFVPDLLNVALTDARSDGDAAASRDLAELPTGARIQPHHLPMIDVARGARTRARPRRSVMHA